MNGDAFGWRPIERRDAADWAGLLAAIRTVDRSREYFTEQDLLEEFGDPYCDYARGSVAIHAGHTMVGYGVLTARPAADPVHEMWYDGGVHPAYRERGLGSRLLDWAEAAAVPLHRDRYPGQSLSLLGGCLASNSGAIALYAAHGYHPARWFHTMVRDLSVAPPGDPAPAGVEIVGYTPPRAEDARLIRNEAFRDHWGSAETTAEYWAHIMGYSTVRPAFSFLAYADDEPLGLILCEEFDGYTEATGVRDLYVSMVGTRRASRKRGIASALLARALTEARAAGFGSASLGVDADSPTGALGLYERAGFTVEHTSVSQVKPLPAGEPAGQR